MGRGKVELRRIDNDVSRKITFGKRRAGLLKKERELAVLCDTHVGVLVFDRAGQPVHYCSPHTSWSELILLYESIADAQLQGPNHDDDQVQQMFMEIAELRRERDHLEASLRRQTGEELPSGATKEELDGLDQKLESVLGKVRETKMNVLENQNNFLRQMTNKLPRAAAEAAASASDEGMAAPTLPFGGFFPEVEEGLSTSLQLWPQQLPDVQGFFGL